MDNLIAEWIKFSDMDLKAAKHLYDTMHPQPLEIICYHCQQSAEKAFLIHADIKPPKTHDLKQLRELCENIDSSFDEITLSCTRLTDYGIQPRYPAEEEIIDSDTLLALQDSEKINEFIKEKIIRV